MSKQLLLNFNQDGSLSQSQSTGSAIRQGDSNGEVTLVATFQNRRNDSYVAKLHFERPDGKKQRNIVMTPSASQSNQFEYSFLSGWFFAVAGTAKVTVTITDSNGAVSAQGSYSFAVEPTQVDVVDSTISYDEAAELEGLIAKLAIGYFELPSYDTDGQLDDDQAEEARKTFCFIKRGNELFLFSKEYEGTKHFETIPLMSVTGHKQGWIEISGLDSNSPTWEYMRDDYDMDSAPTQNSPNLITSGGVYNAVATKADLVEGKVPAAQLPSYVDDVVEGYFFNGAFYADASHTELIAGERSKIYVDFDTNLTYRWTGSAYVRVNEAISNVGYIVIDDENEDENGNLTAAQVTEANKEICFIQYTNSEGTMMLVSYHFSGTERYFWSFMTNTLEIGEPDGSPWAYRFRQARIILWHIDDPTSANWQFNEDYDVDVTHEVERTSMDLITSHGVYNAVSTLDAKISKNADDIAFLAEALTKKDLYETQEATFLGMTAVPAGAMVKAYLDGFKGNSAVVNQLVQNGNFADSSYWNHLYGCTSSVSGNSITLTSTVNTVARYDARMVQSKSYIAGHTYFMCAMLKASKNCNPWLSNDVQEQSFSVSANAATFVSYVFTANSNSTGVGVYMGTGISTGDTLQIWNVMLIDLTPNGITSTVSSEVKELLKHKGMDVDSYIPYNAGTLTDSKPTKLYSRNAILASVPLKKIGAIDLSTCNWTHFEYGNGWWQTTDIPNMKYVASNTGIGNVYLANCTARAASGFSAASTGEMAVDTSNFKINNGSASNTPTGILYYELATPSSTISQAVINGLVEHEYDLTLPTLKSAGSVQDESKAGGEKVGKANLNTVSFTYYEDWGGAGVHTTGAFSALIKKPADNYVAANILYENSVTKTFMALNQSTENGIACNAGGMVYARTGSSTAPTGSINYELATPTDFSSTISYPEIFDVYASGCIEIVGDGCDATTKVYFYVEA